ncbi:hypothetical protein BGZ51_007176 [Haplosporangium sp. Z 767]|nr:hypothetical protein BGZ51_007176 [Haplosporangium sp. Z 767]
MQHDDNNEHDRERKGDNSGGGNKDIADKAFPKTKHPDQNTNLDHLRNQEILTHLMDSTAQQTKMSLIAAQEELVQQLEGHVVRDLRDWVMGIRRNSTVASRKGGQSKKISKDVSAAPEDPSAASLSTLSLADALNLADMTVESEGLYLRGDERTMRMNRIVVSGENVVRTDQRHWSWNLDRALATAMAGSEMLCRGPSSLPSAASLSAKGAMAPKTMAMTMSAQRCIDA